MEIRGFSLDEVKAMSRVGESYALKVLEGPLARWHSGQEKVKIKWSKKRTKLSKMA